MNCLKKCDYCSQSPGEFNLLELFSGIGGMHLALQSSGAGNLYSPVNVTAIDINTNANCVYRYNFPDNNLLSRNITALKLDEITKKPIDLVTMSPPCQPFTRLGLKKDLDDLRSDAFNHLMTNVWPQWKQKPRMILLENVKGFETSKAHDLALEVFTNCGYEIREFLLSPNQFGIPNTRLRYYLLAKLPNQNNASSSFIIPKSDSIIMNVPEINLDQICFHCRDNLSINVPIEETINNEPIRIKKFLQYDPNDEQYNQLIYNQFNVPKNIVDKYLPAMDIVNMESVKSCCFTRSYGTLITGTGSLLNISPDKQSTGNQFNKTINCDLKLRYFTPREVANLMCFPDNFKFPTNLTNKQCYKLLGNSINIKVVSFLFKILLAEPIRQLNN
ncbi:tRNA (cytosine(38)-C(5))-methyltransferase-like [Panonychus citri]|uniref:tRNA (cytosine(38)-C(5))-methyltransferase-like n=1 Tax=Panonychus citri TaxID=50023 RepID=UPI0023080130|nr:tRNA (cytosine(38)-C(5))-methyltransferase-like [Panonychus citri]